MISSSFVGFPQVPTTPAPAKAEEKPLGPRAHEEPLTPDEQDSSSDEQVHESTRGKAPNLQVPGTMVTLTSLQALLRKKRENLAATLPKPAAPKLESPPAKQQQPLNSPFDAPWRRPQESPVDKKAKTDATVNQPAGQTAKKFQGPMHGAPWAPPAPPPGYAGNFPAQPGPAYPPAIPMFAAPPPPPKTMPPVPPPPPQVLRGPPAETLSRKAKNALKPNRSSGRLGKWHGYMLKAKQHKSGPQVIEEFWRNNPQPANATEGHAFKPKMPSGVNLDER